MFKLIPHHVAKTQVPVFRDLDLKTHFQIISFIVLTTLSNHSGNLQFYRKRKIGSSTSYVPYCSNSEHDKIQVVEAERILLMRSTGKIAIHYTFHYLL